MIFAMASLVIMASSYSEGSCDYVVMIFGMTIVIMALSYSVEQG